ncbi:hypothetical protein E3N88_30295 [Mikania micrantha]|uniref:Uncharacterized protein n=1 Tax=Mikania micrantha TaxID=192012 RepID=A0A5N6MLZ4_9ASTR|nr:hypothetical protein E3N88_30295 [Mikania micrantha]
MPRLGLTRKLRPTREPRPQKEQGPRLGTKTCAAAEAHDRGTTVIQGKGKGLFNDSDKNVRNPEITPEFLAQNRKQILLLLQKEEKEQQLKEVRAQLEFEDVSVEDMDEDDAETEVKQDKETSQPKIQGGRKENHEDGDCTPKKQAPSVWNQPKGHEEKRWERPRFQPRGDALQPGFSIPRKPVTESEKTPHAGEKRKEIFMLHQLRPTIALKRPRDTGFVGEVVHPIGHIQLPVVVGNETGQREVTMTFLVIRAQSPYDVILGRPGLCLLGAIASTIHSAIKFPTPRGVVTLKSNRRGGRMDRTSRPTSILWTLNRA